MKFWPISDSPGREIPVAGMQGSFWEDRGDRRHAGIDLYAPVGSEVFAIEDGKVIEVRLFTSPQWVGYWNDTFSVLIQTTNNRFLRYAEMQDAVVKEGEFVRAGQVVGHVGKVLDPEKIDHTAPEYVQKLKKAQLPSMLHFEMHATPPRQDSYLGGNYFTADQPEGLLDPTAYLKEILAGK